MSKLPDLQAAVRRLDGVHHATVRWPDPGGPAILRVEFADDADRTAVTQEVVATLRDLAGVDVEDLELEPPPDSPPPPRPQAPAGQRPSGNVREPAPTGTAQATPPAPPPEPGTTAARNRRHLAQVVEEAGDRGARPVFRGMTIDRGELDTAIEVVLAVGEASLRGRAEGLATLRETPRTAASATLTALRDLIPEDVRVQLDWLEVVEGSGPGRPDIVQSAVTCLSRSSEDTFIGSAIVRSDLREAAVRATLDALNRRLARYAAMVA